MVFNRMWIMMTRRTFTALLLLMLAGWCFAQDDKTEVTQYTIKHSTKQMGQATSDMGLVYFRPSYLAPRSYTWAFVDDQFIGVTDAKNYTYGLV